MCACALATYSLPSQSLSGWWLGSQALQDADDPAKANSPGFVKALGAMMVIMGFCWIALAIFDGLLLFRVRWYIQLFVHCSLPSPTPPSLSTTSSHLLLHPLHPYHLFPSPPTTPSPLPTTSPPSLCPAISLTSRQPLHHAFRCKCAANSNDHLALP